MDSRAAACPTTSRSTRRARSSPSRCTSSRWPSGSASLPDLEVVQILSAGIDWVEPHVPDDVTLCNAGDTRSPAVAQWVVAAILADLGGFRARRRRGSSALGGSAARAGRQARGDRRPRLDRAGGASSGWRRSARASAAWRQRARRASSRSSGSPTAVEGADVVVVLAPLSDETRGLVGAEVLARMPDGALLVNAGRGPVVDTDALVDARRRPAGCAPRSTSPTPSRCRPTTSCGRSTASSSRRTTRATRAEAERAAQALARAQILRHRAGLPLRHVVRRGAAGP